jgi:mannose-6-phosphate isomerase-like protein (cupin superfamily)
MYAGKILHINKGEKLSLQYHKKKHETMYISKGSCKVTIDDRTVLGNPGECFEIKPGTIHKIEAINETEIFEVSSPELDDVIRISDNYGRS